MRLVGVMVMTSIGVAHAQGAGAPVGPPGHPPDRDGRGDGRGAPGGGMPIGRTDAVATLGEGKAIGIDFERSQRSLKRGLGQIRYCYEQALRKDPDLAGRVRLTITIDKDGKVADAITTGIEATVDACLAFRAKTWKFPAPTDERGVYIQWIVFRPNESTDASTIGGPRQRDLKPPESPVLVTYGAPKITGQLDAKRALAVVKSDLRSHQYCFVAVDAATTGGLPDSTGTLAIEVDGTGGVTSTSVVGLDTELSACLHRRTQQRSFPPPKDGQPAGISIQVTFKKKPPKQK